MPIKYPYTDSKTGGVYEKDQKTGDVYVTYPNHPHLPAKIPVVVERPPPRPEYDPNSKEPYPKELEDAVRFVKKP
jgi:hypothetical protein